MINLIKAEIYKYIHRPYFYVLTLIVSCVIFIVELLLSYNSSSNRMFIMSVVCPLGANVALMIIGVFSLVFSEEYKYNSLKNLITSNIPKWKIYLGKVLVQIIITFFIGIVILGVFCAGFLLLEPGDGYSNDIFIREIIKIISIFPVFLAGLSLFNLLIIVIKRESIASMVYIVFFLLSSEIIHLLSKTIWSGLDIINYYLFQTQTSIMKDLMPTNSAIIYVMLVGILNFIIFTILGGIMFKRAEVH